jgi:hypothetical protein
MLAPGQARAQTPESQQSHEQIHQFFSTLEGLADQLADRTAELNEQARQAIIAGGAVVSLNRYTISGGALGCALGATLGASTMVASGVPTGGATIAATPNAMILGCALGAATGAAMGYPLDYPGGR